jgi:hypothetical protein
MGETYMKPKVAFIFECKDERKWLDGLYSALNILDNDYDLQRFNLISESTIELELFNPDFVLGWGGFNSNVDKYIKNLHGKYKTGLCIGGNGFQSNKMDYYNVLFYETTWIREFLELKYHSNIIHAFGINSDIYNPATIPTPVIWDFIGVGSLSNWKRWDKFLNLPSSNRLVIGEYQVDNLIESQQISNNLLANGVMISNSVSPFDLVNYYHWSRILYMPSTIYGGGERAILEARACGLKIMIEEDNDKLKELLTSPIWDEKYYAKQLTKGINSCL